MTDIKKFDENEETNMMDFSLVTDEPLDYCVYMHKNKITGEIYIGITKNIVNRWCANGKKYKSSPEFFKAIQKFGWNNFEHIILKEKIPKSIALIMECELIKKYNLTETGYNKSEGSWDSIKPVISHPVYQYELDGTFVKKWNSISEAVNEYGDGVYKNVNGISNKAGGFQWTKEYVEKMPHYGSNKRHRYLPVFEYSIEGDFIREWNTLKEAMDEYGPNIIECVQGRNKTSYNRRWSFEKVDSLLPLPPTVKKHKTPSRGHYSYENTPKVYKYDLYGKLIKIYNNVAAIDDSEGDKVNIYRQCKDKNYHIIHNMLWIYEDYANDKLIRDIINKYREHHYKIIQYDTEGNYLRTFSGYKEIEKEGYNPKIVTRIVKHKSKTAYGFQWRSEFDTAPGKVEYPQRIYDYIPIMQKTLDGEIVKIFKNMKEAALYMKAKSSNHILNVCRGNKKTGYGFLWQFATREEYENYINNNN